MLTNKYAEHLRLKAITTFRLRSDLEKIIKTIDVEQVKAFQEKYKGEGERSLVYKYLNIDFYLPRNLMRFYRLNLHEAQPMKILDIGTGVGYFPYICTYFGHEVIAVDRDHVPSFTDMTELLKVDRRVMAVMAFEKLPDFGTKFDLITAFRTAFNNHVSDDGTRIKWKKEEWDFFFRDLVANQLTPNGKVFIDLNPDEQGRYYDDELLGYFQSHGAKINVSKMLYESMDKFR